MADQNSPDDYEVGYGKPPKASRFKPGQSGNPRGRPQNRESIQAKVEKLFNRKVAVMANGQKQSVSLLDAAFAGLAQAALQGSVDKRISTLRFLLSFAPPPTPEEGKMDYSCLSDEELATLETILVKAYGGDTEG